MHSIVAFLVAQRRANATMNPDWAFRPLDEVCAEATAWKGFDVRRTRELLQALEDFGVVERAADKSSWRATALADEALREAYADRHPLKASAQLET